MASIKAWPSKAPRRRPIDAATQELVTRLGAVRADIDRGRALAITVKAFDALSDAVHVLLRQNRIRDPGCVDRAHALIEAFIDAHWPSTAQ